MKTKILALCLTLGYVRSSYAQSGDLLRVMQPSPTSQEFDKYINQEVSLYNGIPEIKIPLYTIQIGKMEVPIELKYHASGIKFGQASGEVGVGWVLDPGYRISRTMHGRPDEYFQMPQNMDTVFTISGQYQKDSYLAKFGRDNEMELPYTPDTFDGEYDMFTYSLSSSGGTFLITDRQQRKIKTSNTGLDTITYTQNAQGMITNFDIVDGNGVSYRIGKELTSANLVYERNLGAIFSKGITPTSWMLTDMVDPFGQYIRFHYKNFQENNSITAKSLYTVATVEYGESSCSPYTGNGTLNSIPQSTYEIQRLTDIMTENEIVRFYRQSNPGMLDSIVVTLPNGKRLKKFVFNYFTNALHRFLNSVTEFGTSDVDGKVYTFNYINQNYNGNGDLIADYWGYYRRTFNNYYSFPNFGNIVLCKGTMGALPLSSFGMTMTDRQPVSGEDASYFTLNKITYPTGGSTTFEYDANKYFGARDDNSLLGIKYVGIRIKKISFNDLIENETLVKEYQYGTTADETGNVTIDLGNKNLFVSEGIFADCANSGSALNALRLLRTVTYKTNPDEELASAAGNPVYYSRVTEIMRRLIPQTNQWEYNGKTEYNFLLPDPIYYQGYPVNSSYNGYNGITDYPGAECSGMGSSSGPIYRKYPSYYVSRDASWDKPVLKSRIVYQYLNGQFVRLQKDDNEYISTWAELPGLKVRKFFHSSATYNSGKDYYSSGISSLFDYAGYSVAYGDKVLSRTTTTYYSNGSELLKEHKFSYNPYLQINKEETTNSDQLKMIVYKSYPKDYGTITGTDPISSGVKTLLQQHILTPTLETTIAKADSNGANERVISSSYLSFKSNAPLQDKAYVIEEALPPSNFNRTSQANGIVNIDAHYKQKVLFNSFDSHGNILEQQKADDIAETYIWGYNYQYPVAKITGASYSTAIALLNLAILQQPTSDQQLRDELNKLRIYLPSGKVLVNTYTYMPKIGMTSETDPAGHIIFYEYDPMGRLKLIRDANGKIMKQYDYQYQKPITQ